MNFTLTQNITLEVEYYYSYGDYVNFVSTAQKGSDKKDIRRFADSIAVIRM